MPFNETVRVAFLGGGVGVENIPSVSDFVDGPQGLHIALVASHSALLEGLVRVIEKHVAGSRVVLMERLPSAREIDQTVRLVLLHGSAPAPMGDNVAACRSVFPNAAIGLISDNTPDDIALFNRFFAQRQVQGLLPLSFKLDVWLAAVSLLLSGGEYFPYLRSEAAPVEAVAAAAPQRREGPVHAAPVAQPDERDRLAAERGLTKREVEILRLVSEGHQNKHIAHHMALSEHTVKVHVHNLITKLRVNNRTQAAAAFRAGPSRTTMTLPPPAIAARMRPWTVIETT